jgi:tetratricopeptide (TPR) repeat protein
MVQQGLKDLCKAIEINSSNIYSYNGLTLYYWTSQQHDKAIEFLLNAIKKQPSSFELHNRLASYYLDLKKTELFENEIKIMNKLSPNHPRSNILIGVSLLSNKKYNDLEEYLSEQNKMNFYANDKLYLRGLLLSSQSKYKEAIDIFEDLSKNGYIENALPNLAEAYFKIAEYQKSIDSLLKLNEKKPLNEEMLKLMKLAKEKLNQK